MPKKRPKLCAKTIRERDGNRCRYTGKLLRPDEGSLDHVLPRSRGGIFDLLVRIRTLACSFDEVARILYCSVKLVQSYHGALLPMSCQTFNGMA